MNAFIALAKGELGKDIEKYLKNYGIMVQLDGRPLQFVQRNGRRIFRPMKSKDVPWYVAKNADYGITGEDMAAEYNMGNGGKVKILERLGFGKSDLVVFAKCPASEIKGKAKERVTVAVSGCYANLLQKAGAYIQGEFGGFDAVVVDGSTESFVADGTADIGFDLTTYFARPVSERGRTTIEANGLTILERVMPTEAVVISKPCYTADDFHKTLGAPRRRERRVITTGNMSEVEIDKYVGE